VILTGTPAPNGLIQLWSQIFILDIGKRLSKYITHYRTKYFYQVGYMGYEYKLIPDADKLIYQVVDDIIMHKSSDELDLPPIIYNEIKVQLPKAAYAIYEDMRKHAIANDDTLVAINAAAQGSKLKQIANGNVYTEDKKSVHMHNEKLEAIKDLVEELSGRPLLVMYEYLHDLISLQNFFKDAPNIGGGSKDLNKVITEWNSGEIPVMFLQPQAGGHGLNLQDSGCHDIAWFSIPFDLELYLQANARVHRQGVKNSVTIHHIIAENTIDEKIMNVLKGKDTLQNALLQALLK
jgi:SNF2 family DNA or RNA helicase